MTTSDIVKKAFEDKNIEVTLYENPVHGVVCVVNTYNHDQQIRNEVIDKVIELIDSYPNDLDRKTEETHLIFATLSDIITHIRQMKEIE